MSHVTSPVLYVFIVFFLQFFLWVFAFFFPHVTSLVNCPVRVARGLVAEGLGLGVVFLLGFCGIGFRVWGLGSRVQGLGFRFCG